MSISYTRRNKRKKVDGLMIMGITLAVIFSLVFINLAFNIVTEINSVILGSIGFLGYVLSMTMVIVGILMIMHKRPSKTYVYESVLIGLLLFSVIAIFHIATIRGLIARNFTEYVSATYQYKLSLGGALFSVLTYPVVAFTYEVASYVIYSVMAVVVLTLLIDRIYKDLQIKPTVNYTTPKELVQSALKNVSAPEKEKEILDDDIFIADDELDEDDHLISKEKQDIIEEPKQDKEADRRSEIKKILGITGVKNTRTDTSKTDYVPSKELKKYAKNFTIEDDVQEFFGKKTTMEKQKEKPEFIFHNSDDDLSMVDTPKGVGKGRKLTEKEKQMIEFLHATTGVIPSKAMANTDKDIYDSSLTKKNYESKGYTAPYHEPPKKVIIEDTKTSDFTINKGINDFTNHSALSGNDFDTEENDSELERSNFENSKYNNYVEHDTETIQEDDFETEDYNKVESYTVPKKLDNSAKHDDSAKAPRTMYRDENLTPIEIASKIAPPVVQEKPMPKPRAPYHYTAPSIELLKKVEIKNEEDIDDNENKAIMLEQTLSSFKIDAKVVSITHGPTFTRFEMQMPAGIPVKKVMNYTDDIAMTLESHGGVRMEIPIPGRNTFGVEVPNKVAEMVPLRDIIESYQFESCKSKVPFALGKDLTGEAVVSKMDKLTHLLIAGTTGSGKSVCLNALLVSILYKSSPEDVKILLIDPKRVEFTPYNGIPHLIIPNVINDVEKAIDALDWTIKEMERRFLILQNSGARKIDDYNSTEDVRRGLKEKMPYLIVVVDEVGDLMSQNKKDVEAKLQRLLAKSRAAGIHLVLATQRPSVDVITGTLKNNLPSRIAFQVISVPDSRTILDQAGAEKLLGRGDMLFQAPDKPFLERIQGAFVSNEEIADVVEFVKENNDCDFDPDIEDAMFNKNKQSMYDEPSDDFDPMMKDILRMAIRNGSISASKIQRAYSYGWNRAARIMDQMEKCGFISGPDNKNNRVIYITQQEFEERFGEDL